MHGINYVKRIGSLEHNESCEKSYVKSTTKQKKYKMVQDRAWGKITY